MPSPTINCILNILTQISISFSELFNNGDYYGTRGVFPQCDGGQFDAHQRLDAGLHMNGNLMSENSYPNILREATNPNFVKQPQHTTTLHHTPLQNTTQESSLYQNNIYSYQPNNLHMNSVAAMWWLELHRICHNQ
jgi:hypothetical protein